MFVTQDREHGCITQAVMVIAEGTGPLSPGHVANCATISVKCVTVFI